DLDFHGRGAGLVERQLHLVFAQQVDAVVTSIVRRLVQLVTQLVELLHQRLTRIVAADGRRTGAGDAAAARTSDGQIAERVIRDAEAAVVAAGGHFARQRCVRADRSGDLIGGFGDVAYGGREAEKGGT